MTYGYKKVVVESALWSILLLFYPHFIVFAVNDDKYCWKKHPSKLSFLSHVTYFSHYLIPSSTLISLPVLLQQQDLCHKHRLSHVNVIVHSSSKGNIKSCNWSIVRWSKIGFYENIQHGIWKCINISYPAMNKDNSKLIL